jgi:hypothetical protein
VNILAVVPNVDVDGNDVVVGRRYQKMIAKQKSVAYQKSIANQKSVVYR